MKGFKRIESCLVDMVTSMNRHAVKRSYVRELRRRLKQEEGVSNEMRAAVESRIACVEALPAKN